MSEVMQPSLPLWLSRDPDAFGGLYHLWVGQPVNFQGRWIEDEIDPVTGMRTGQFSIELARWSALPWTKGEGPQLMPGSSMPVSVEEFPLIQKDIVGSKFLELQDTSETRAIEQPKSLRPCAFLDDPLP